MDLGGKKEGEKLTIEERPEENSFLDFEEPAFLDEFTYRQIEGESKKYGYAVKNA